MADAPLHPEVEAAYRRKWREIVGVNPPHEGNSTHRACLLAAALLAAEKARERLRASVVDVLIETDATWSVAEAYAVVDEAIRRGTP